MVSREEVLDIIKTYNKANKNYFEIILKVESMTDLSIEEISRLITIHNIIVRKKGSDVRKYRKIIVERLLAQGYSVKEISNLLDMSIYSIKVTMEQNSLVENIEQPIKDKPKEEKRRAEYELYLKVKELHNQNYLRKDILQILNISDYTLAKIQKEYGIKFKTKQARSKPTEEECAEMQRYYDSIGKNVSTMMENLQLSRQGVYNLLNRYKVNYRKKARRKEDVIKLIQGGNSLEKICTELNLSIKDIRRLCAYYKMELPYSEKRDDGKKDSEEIKKEILNLKEQVKTKKEIIKTLNLTNNQYIQAIGKERNVGLITLEDLQKLIDKGLTNQEIAEKYQVKTSYVNNLVSYYKRSNQLRIENTSRQRNYQKLGAKIEERLKDGTSIEDIAKGEGVSDQTIRRILKKLNYEYNRIARKWVKKDE